MKFNKTIALATLASVGFVSAAFATPFLSLHRYSLASPSPDEVFFKINADKSIPDATPVEVSIDGHTVAHGIRFDNQPFHASISKDYDVSVITTLSELKNEDVSKMVVTISTGGKQIPNCIATVSSGSSDPISTAVTKTMTISRTSTGYACNVN